MKLDQWKTFWKHLLWLSKLHTKKALIDLPHSPLPCTMLENLKVACLHYFSHHDMCEHLMYIVQHLNICIDCIGYSNSWVKGSKSKSWSYFGKVSDNIVVNVTLFKRFQFLMYIRWQRQPIVIPCLIHCSCHFLVY